MRIFLIVLTLLALALLRSLTTLAWISLWVPSRAWAWTCLGIESLVTAACMVGPFLFLFWSLDWHDVIPPFDPWAPIVGNGFNSASPMQWVRRAYERGKQDGRPAWWEYALWLWLVMLAMVLGLLIGRAG